MLKDVDGEPSVIATHPDEESAQQQASTLDAAADRFSGAFREEAVPDNYPGKGQDETGNVPLKSPGA